ncbi:hypothetical protein [Sphingomonas desiccabilis]|nr:hypothetical protein [Sphingomonas desiccabilis]MBB3911064.1 hypothetical protein [Sphingomonas desiccabilis]
MATAIWMASAAAAEEPARAPDAVRQLEGCWQGRGEVMGKPVTIAVEARPVALGAMLALDASSVAIDDPSDRYAAHLVLGGGKGSADVIGFWSDSFGGTMTAIGSGTLRANGFDIGYRYGEATFLNGWQVAGERLRWEIVAQEKGTSQAFASYVLTRAACVSGAE